MKRRVSYPMGMRPDAKAAGKGLVTISIEFPDGEVLEEQAAINAIQAQFVKWAAAMIFVPEVAALPDLEGIIRDLIEKKS